MKTFPRQRLPGRAERRGEAERGRVGFGPSGLPPWSKVLQKAWVAEGSLAAGNAALKPLPWLTSHLLSDLC